MAGGGREEDALVDLIAVGLVAPSGSRHFDFLKTLPIMYRFRPYVTRSEGKEIVFIFIFSLFFSTVPTTSLNTMALDLFLPKLVGRVVGSVYGRQHI